MRKVINGARYDTESAKKIGSWENMEDAGNLHYYSETMYRTKSGKYFLFGEGGPGSKAAKQTEENSWAWGEKITPISEEAAKKWASEYLNADKYEAIFGNVSDNTKQVAAYLPDNLLKKLDEYKAQHKKSRSDIIIAALQEYLK